MPRGSKASYSSKQKRMAAHIEDSVRKRGGSEKEAERIGWATVNKETGGAKGKKSSSRSTNSSSSNKSSNSKNSSSSTKKSSSGTKKSSSSRKSTSSSRSAAAKKGWETRRKNSQKRSSK